MANSVALKAALVVVACMVIAEPYGEAITCGQIASGIAPCFGYMRGTGPLPPNCCSAVKSLNAAASTPADRKIGCGCLKQIATTTPGIKLNLAAGIPAKCGVNIGFPISLSVDCSKVN